MHTDGFLVSRGGCVLGIWGKGLDAVVVVVLAREVLATAILLLTGEAEEELIKVSVEDVEKVVVSVEHTAVEGGKTDPFKRGRGRTGLGAVPTILPTPGKVSAAEATAAC